VATGVIPKDAVKSREWGKITQSAAAFIDAVKTARQR
jgi:hypothetical protein